LDQVLDVERHHLLQGSGLRDDPASKRPARNRARASSCAARA
jgi:hypothetical protein